MGQSRRTPAEWRCSERGLPQVSTLITSAVKLVSSSVAWQWEMQLTKWQRRHGRCDACCTIARMHSHIYLQAETICWKTNIQYISDYHNVLNSTYYWSSSADSQTDNVLWHQFSGGEGGGSKTTRWKWLKDRSFHKHWPNTALAFSSIQFCLYFTKSQ